MQETSVARYQSQALGMVPDIELVYSSSAVSVKELPVELSPKRSTITNLSKPGDHADDAV